MTDQTTPSEFPEGEPGGDVTAGRQEPAPLVTTPKKRRFGPGFWAAVIAGIVIVAGVGTALALGLPGRLWGKTDLAAAAMPLETDTYVGIDLLQLTPDKLDRVVKPLAGVDPETDIQNANDAITELDESMERDFGVTFTEDIRPWLGQYAGMGILNLEFDEFGEVIDPSIIFSIEARDKKAADQFLEKFFTNLKEKQDLVVQEQDLDGVKVYSFDQGADTLAVARSQSLLLVATGMDDIQAAIQAQEGDSLQDNEAYKSLLAELPSGRAMTVFVSLPEFLKGIAPAMEGLSLETMESQITQLDLTAVSLSIVDKGVQIDAVSLYDPEKMSEAQRKMMDLPSGTGKIAELLPADTFLMIATQGLNLAWQAGREQLASQLGGDIDEAMQLAEKSLGFNPETDLINYLDGELSLSVAPNQEGLLMQLLGISLDVRMLAKTSAPESLLETFEKFNQFAESQGMSITDLSAGENHLYSLGEAFTGDLLFYGLGKEHMSLATSRAGAEFSFNPDGTLADDASYQAIWKEFPSGTAPVVYIDLLGFVEYIQGSALAEEIPGFEDVLGYLKVVPTVVVGSVPTKGDVSHSSILIVIEQPE